MYQGCPNRRSSYRGRTRLIVKLISSSDLTAFGRLLLRHSQAFSAQRRGASCGTRRVPHAINRPDYEQGGRFNIAAAAARAEIEEGAVDLKQTHHIKVLRVSSPVQGRPAGGPPLRYAVRNTDTMIGGSG